MKPGQADQLQSIRNTRRAMYLIAVLYVTIGLALALLSVMRRDPLGTFLGFLIVSGALGGAVVLASVLKLSTQSERLASRLEELAGGLTRMENALAGLAEEERIRASAVRKLDLSQIGPGDPSLLTATTLDRAVYPRLLRTMDEEPPARSEEVAEDAVEPAPIAALKVPSARADGDPLAHHAIDGPATKNLLAQWRRAVREGDLASCRAVYSAMVDVAGPEQLGALERELDGLIQRVEKELREAFARSVRERNFAAALSAGEEIGRLLADRPVAREFHRLRPYLVHRLEGSPPPARSAAT